MGLVYAEESLPSGFCSLIVAVIPLYVALIEMFLPGGEPMPRRGWLGMAIGFARSGSAALAFVAHRFRRRSLASCWPSALCWRVRSPGRSAVFFRAAPKLPVNSFVAASWQMLAAGIFNTSLGTVLGQWPQFHLNRAAIGSLAWLVTGGSLLGYTGFIYLIEHVPVAKVSSYAYVNPVVAVLLGILCCTSGRKPAEFVGMAAVVLAVFPAHHGTDESEAAPRFNETGPESCTRRNSGCGLLVECRRRHQLRIKISIESDGGSLEVLERRIVARHGHPADGSFLQQAARNLQGVRHFRMALGISLGALDPHVVASHGSRTHTPDRRSRKLFSGPSELPSAKPGRSFSVRIWPKQSKGSAIAARKDGGAPWRALIGIWTQAISFFSSSVFGCRQLVASSPQGVWTAHRSHPSLLECDR